MIVDVEKKRETERIQAFLRMCDDAKTSYENAVAAIVRICAEWYDMGNHHSSTYTKFWDDLRYDTERAMGLEPEKVGWWQDKQDHDDTIRRGWYK